MDTWHSFRCPACGAGCIFFAGDMADPTGYGVENVRCWKCRARWTFDGDGYLRRLRKKRYCDDTLPLPVAPGEGEEEE